MEKLIFLALDGLSWNVIKEMLSENKLKNIKKLVKEGIFREGIYLTVITCLLFSPLLITYFIEL